MTGEDVLTIYEGLKDQKVQIWIDGGWCVDCLLGRQTRPHPDLDIAVDRRDADNLSRFLTSRGYTRLDTDDATDWNYVMADGSGHSVDVHVFEFDADGRNIYGIEYPKDSLTGTGTINGRPVNCISPEWMFKFKTAYQPKEKDLQDVQALSAKFGFEVPASHRGV